MNNIYKTIYNEIKKYKKIYIARHIGADPDAYGSQIGLKESIKCTFPKKEVYALGSGVSRFKFMGKLDKITNIDYENSLLIVVDTPDKKRVDIENFEQFKNVIKIDHHPKVDTFGICEYICENASSASELVLKLIENTKLKNNNEIASILFAGIVSDTNRFLFNTTSETFILVSNLIKKYKLNIEKIYKDVYCKPLSEVRLMGHIATTLKVDKYGFAYIELDDDILNTLGVDNSAPSNMINDFNNIKEILVWAFITRDEKNNLYRVNIRSRGPIINEIAARHNGGGHKFASGVRTSSREDIDNLLKELSSACMEFKKESE